MRAYRRGFTIKDLAVAVSCLLVAGSLLISQIGAVRSLSQTDACADNLRQLFAGMTAYVNQYNCYPPHAPWPEYMANESVNGMNTMGWDPNIGFILTYGLGLQPPATDTATGHFKWYGAAFASLPDVCKCPSLPAAMLDPSNPEIADPAHDSTTPLETVLFQYALSYQTSGTCRAACQVVTTDYFGGQGGRNSPIPDPRSTSASRAYNNTQRSGPPYVYVFQKSPGEPVNVDSGSSFQDYACWIQATNPAQVQSPGRVYYLADSRDYRPAPKGQPYDGPPAGFNNGWVSGWGGNLFLGTRHSTYANVLYLDGRVAADNQTHVPQWNMDYDPVLGPQSDQWRMATFATKISRANIQGQVYIMPVLMVKGWEYFFDANGEAVH